MNRISTHMNKLFPLTLFILFMVSSSMCLAQMDELPITTQSDEARQAFLQGREKFELLRMEEAHNLFQEAVDDDNNFALAYIYLGLTAPTNEAFVEDIQQAADVADDVSSGEQKLVKAFQYYTQQDAQKAVQTLSELASQYPSDKRVQVFLGNAYYNMQDYDKAIAQYKKAVDIDADFAPVYNILGYAYRANGDYSDAETALKKYVSLLPDEANPHDSIGDLYTKMGRFEEAVTHYSKAVELNPDFYVSQRNIGLNYAFLGKFDQAREAIRKAIEMDPTPSGKTYEQMQLAYTYLYQKNLSGAEQEMTKALNMAENNDDPETAANIHLSNSQIYLFYNKPDKADEQIQQVQSIIEDADLPDEIIQRLNQNHVYHQAMIASANGNYSDAMDMANQYKNSVMNLNNPQLMKNYHELIGVITLDKKDYAGAIPHFKEANQHDPMVIYKWAEAESGNGNTMKAHELYNKVANWNDNSLNYALVRPRAMEMMKMKVASEEED